MDGSMDGIYILGNDVVFDQVIALINSVQEHNSDRYPICVIPYDNRIERLKTAVLNYSQVTVLDNPTLFQRWDEFVVRAWEEVPFRQEFWNQGGTQTGIHRMGTHRRFVAFDEEAPFSRFIYLDADIITLAPLDILFTRLNSYDFITYDFQHKDPSHVFNIELDETHEFLAQDGNDKRIFCSGMFGSKTGLITPDKREQVIEALRAGGGRLLYPPAPDQTLLNYMAIALNLSYSNMGIDLPAEERTGCCVTSPHFEKRAWKLYDKGVPLIYLHYIGLSARFFKQLCSGENIDFPYRDIFLHYRYLKHPEDQPKFQGQPVPYNAPPGLFTRLKQKIKKQFSA